LKTLGLAVAGVLFVAFGGSFVAVERSFVAVELWFVAVEVRFVAVEFPWWRLIPSSLQPSALGIQPEKLLLAAGCQPDRNHFRDDEIRPPIFGKAIFQ